MKTCNQHVKKPNALGFALVLLLPIGALVLTSEDAEAAWPADDVLLFLFCTKKLTQQTTDLVQAWGSFVGATVLANYQTVKCKLHDHPPIIINGPLTTTQANSIGIINGNGQPWNPWIIEGWNFAGRDFIPVYTGVAGAYGTWVPGWSYSALGGHKVGITIRDTGQCFLIRNVYVHDFETGIRLENQHCTTISTSVIERVSTGISVSENALGRWIPSPVITGNLVNESYIGVWYDQPSSPSGTTLTMQSNDLRVEHAGLLTNSGATATSNLIGCGTYGSYFGGAYWSPYGDGQIHCGDPNFVGIGLYPGNGSDLGSNSINCRNRGVGIRLAGTTTVTLSGNSFTSCPTQVL